MRWSGATHKWRFFTYARGSDRHPPPVRNATIASNPPLIKTKRPPNPLRVNVLLETGFAWHLALSVYDVKQNERGDKLHCLCKVWIKAVKGVRQRETLIVWRSQRRLVLDVVLMIPTRGTGDLASGWRTREEDFRQVCDPRLVDAVTNFLRALQHKSREQQMGQGLQENTDLKFSSRNLIDVALTVAQGGEWHVYECEGKKEKREEENEVLRMTRCWWLYHWQ